jgi:hypothetical protein
MPESAKQSETGITTSPTGESQLKLPAIPALIARSGLSFAEIHCDIDHAVDIKPTPAVSKVISSLPMVKLPLRLTIPGIFPRASASLKVAVTYSILNGIIMIRVTSKRE